MNKRSKMRKGKRLSANAYAGLKDSELLVMLFDMQPKNLPEFVFSSNDPLAKEIRRRSYGSQYGFHPFKEILGDFTP